MPQSSSGYILLSIDTALDKAGIALSNEKELLGSKTNTRQMDHASWIHSAIRDLIRDCGLTMDALSAVAVVEGPGSYTGLRVGMATAKGLCYALKKPLLTINSLFLIANAQKPWLLAHPKALVSPMIDARRMEVFAAVYDATMSAIQESRTLILEKESFAEYLEDQSVIFAGNGVDKWKRLCEHRNAIFSDLEPTMELLSVLAADKFLTADFADLAYAEPAYIKNVYIAPSPQKEK